MSSMTKESLTEEIIANARRDRKRLEAVIDGLANGFARVPTQEDDNPDEFNPDVAAAFAEEISKIGDSLTRINQQLVELVKIDAKKPSDQNPVRLGKEDVDAVYDEINPQEAN